MATQSALLDLDEARVRTLAAALPLMPCEQIDLLKADGCILREDIKSDLSVPPLDNSAMDGWAVRSEDLTHDGAKLVITQRIAAGDHSNQPLRKGEAARIFTGAAIPPGADAIVMQEKAQVLDDCHVAFHEPVRPGQWIRRAGEDVKRGQLIFESGHRLTPADIGLLASLGRSMVKVSAKPRVALFATGNELVLPGAIPSVDLPPGKIFNSNFFFLNLLLKRTGAVVSHMEMIPDRLDATVQAFQKALDDHDLIVTSGGVSVGEEDHVKPAVERLGKLNLWSISMKPGKPFAFGHFLEKAHSRSKCHFMGLPGNPVSSFVTFMLLVRPFLLALQGCSQLHLNSIPMKAAFNWTKPDRRREFIRVKLNQNGELDLFPNQSSGVLTSLSWADGVVDVPSGQVIHPGDTVNFIPWSFH